MKELIWTQQQYQQHDQTETFYNGPKEQQELEQARCEILNDLYGGDELRDVVVAWKPEGTKRKKKEPHNKLNSRLARVSNSDDKSTIPNHGKSEDDDDGKQAGKARNIFLEQNGAFPVSEASSNGAGKNATAMKGWPTIKGMNLSIASCPITEVNHYHWHHPIGKNRFTSSCGPVAAVNCESPAEADKTLFSYSLVRLTSQHKAHCDNAESEKDSHLDCEDDRERERGFVGQLSPAICQDNSGSCSNDNKVQITNNEVDVRLNNFMAGENRREKNPTHPTPPPHNSVDIHGLLVKKGLGRGPAAEEEPTGSNANDNKSEIAETTVEKSSLSSSHRSQPSDSLLSHPVQSLTSPTTISDASSPAHKQRSSAAGTTSREKGEHTPSHVTHKSVAFLLNLLLLLDLSHNRLLNGVEAGNIPLGVVVEQGSAEIQSAFAFALTTFTPLNISRLSPGEKYAFNLYVDTINTADSTKLSKLICNQFFRGVYAIVGSMNSESFQTFHSYANTFQMPIVTPGFPTKPRKVSKFQIRQNLSLNPAMDFVLRGENSSLSPLVRSKLINDTFQKRLDSAPEPSSEEKSENRESLITKLVDEIVAKESSRLDFVTKIRPDLHQAILDITAHYGWRNVIYLFHSNEGLLRLQSIFEKQGFKNDSIRVRVMKKISSVMDALSIIRNIEVAQRFQPKHIILDCPASLAKDIIISHVRDLHLGRRTYHYLIAGLAFDEPWERSVVEFTAVNITGFRMVDPNRKLVKDFLSKWATLDTNQFEGGGKRYISATAALMYDGMLVIKEAFTDILRENPHALHREKGRNLTCNTGIDFLNTVVPFEHGRLINQRLRRVQAEGLTGHIEFNEQGSRTNFTVDVMEITLENGQTKVGEWSDVSGFVTAQQLSDPLSKRKKPDTKKEYIVTSILEEPYLMIKKAEKGEILTGNDQYEGFCKDLADTIAKNMNIKYKITLVKDKKYGAENPAASGGWDGMIGELIRKEADMSISPLTITAQRETVVDFSMDFMEAGISIMIKKPQTEMPGAFSFVKPMRGSVWLASFAALVVVASVLLVVQGIPRRHRSSSANSDAANADGSHITFPNTLWFSIASVFRQSTPFTPRYCVIVAYIGVSLVLYIVSRCNTAEWITETEGTLHNQFSFPNALWFCFAALVQQGSDLSPRSISGRITGSVWWFFTLILISSYTANFAAVRTVNRMILPIKSAKDLSEQTDVQYGTLLGGSTYEFFRRSEVPVYKRMFEFMSGPNQQNVKSYDAGITMVRERKGKYALLIESPKNDYTNQRKPCDTIKIGPNLDSKGFGIGTPLGSPLKHQINLEVLRLKENGILSKLESKWWFERSECDVTNKQETTTGDEELSLGSLAGIFYILIIGLVLSMVVSFLEFCYNSKKEAQKSKLTLTEAMKKKAKNTITGPITQSLGNDPVTCIH